MLKDNIKKYRIRAGFTQGQLGKLLGLSTRSTISMWESGLRRPQVPMLPRLAKVLGCTMDELFSEDEQCK